MTGILENKHIVLGVSGGIAAYKSVELLRLLTKQGADIRVLMTRNACRFVGPLTFEALSGKAVCTHLFEEGHNASIGHIAWAKDADAVIVAPATANIIGKIAGGIADDALTYSQNLLLSTTKLRGVLVALLREFREQLIDAFELRPIAAVLTSIRPY